MQKTVAVNDAGFRIGEDHQNAKLTDHEVDLIRQLHEKDGVSYRTLAEKFGVSKGSIVKICLYERRNQFATNIKKVPVPKDV